MSSDIPSAEELERLYAMSSDGPSQQSTQQKPRPSARRVVQRRVAEAAGQQVTSQRTASQQDRARQAELDRARQQTALLAEERRQRKIASLADSLALPSAPPPEPVVITKTRGPGFVAGFVLGVIAGVVLTWWRSR